ncbi:MAG: thiolase family protein [Steroidobacteraceae bacterium]|nr:thiolase family protein [Steroidobacteraceae bacterium]MDW8260297.1 thiolase family protein [Gammaproteobacteria bacterium]
MASKLQADQVLAIVGVGETEFRRRHELGLSALVVEAARRAIADSGLSAREIDGIVVPVGMPPIDEIALGAGLAHRRYSAINAYTPGAGPVAALIEARAAILAGRARAVLVPYGIRTSIPGGPYAYHAADPLKADLEMPVGFYGQPIYFAAIAQRYAYEFGLRPEQLGALAVAQREWAARTPNSQKSTRITLDDYLRSPPIAGMLRALDCCLITDGAAAYVVTSLAYARRLPQPPAIVAGVAAGSNPWTLTEMFTQSPRYLDIGPGAVGCQALAEAGVTHADLAFAQIYDCFTMSVLLQLESLGFCAAGEGGAFVAGGRTGPGGEFPVNTDGGHLSHAYIPGITHVLEAVRQIRGTRGAAQVPGARFGVVSTFAGPDHATLVLARDA